MADLDGFSPHSEDVILNLERGCGQLPTTLDPSSNKLFTIAV